MHALVAQGGRALLRVHHRRRVHRRPAEPQARPSRAAPRAARRRLAVLLRGAAAHCHRPDTHQPFVCAVVCLMVGGICSHVEVRACMCMRPSPCTLVLVALLCAR